MSGAEVINDKCRIFVIIGLANPQTYVDWERSQLETLWGELDINEF